MTLTDTTTTNGTALSFQLTLPPYATTTTSASGAAPAIASPERALGSRSQRRLSALARPDRKPVRAEIPPNSTGDTTATIRLYDPIDSWGEFWGVSAKEFASVLDDLPESVTEIHLLINSPGGECTEGFAILNLLRRHPAKVVGIVEGMAASAASVVAVGCDELVMCRNSEMFIHNAWGLCVGDAPEMRQMADELDHLSDNLASVYADKAGGTVTQWREVMATDKWYSAEEAVEAGLADRVDDGSKPEDATQAKARFDRSIFASARNPATPPDSSPAQGQRGGGPVADLTKLREALGVAEDTPDDQVVEWLAAEATASKPPPAPAPLPDGVTTIDSAQLEQLKADARSGVEARAEQLRQHRATIVAAAVADGRIPPARSDAWLAQLEADPGAETVLAGLAKGTIPVAAKGTEADDLETEFAEYVAIYGKDG